MSFVDPIEVEKFIEYTQTFFEHPQISLKPIRDRQDPALVQKLLLNTLKVLQRTNLNLLPEKTFFVGSVDFMVRREDGTSYFYILETNGGSSRGFSILTHEEWEKAYDGFLESLTFLPRRPLVLLSHPDKDLLYYEKVFLAQNFALHFKNVGETKEAKVLSVKDFREKGEEGLVLIGSYSEILPRLAIKDNFITLDGKKIGVLIGDGLARRHPEISKRVLTDSFETIIINEVFPITDDKALTYLAVLQAKDILAPFNIRPLGCWRAFDQEELQENCKELLSEAGELVIKPHGGSGGAGIEILAEKALVSAQIEDSIEHYHAKLGPNRNPFPYTICQRVEATPANWRGRPHHFDIRVYVARKGEEILPWGALSRIALEPFDGKFTKKSFVVNLSGYGGVDTDRGLGISAETLEILGLKEEDFQNMFCAAAIIMAYIGKHYREIEKQG